MWQEHIRVRKVVREEEGKKGKMARAKEIRTTIVWAKR